MATGRRSDLMLGGLCFVAVVNGVLLGLTLYSLLAAALGVVGAHAPSLFYALTAGALAGTSLLVLALHREQALRDGSGSYGPWAFGHAEQLLESPLARALDDLVASSSLSQAPSLHLLHSADPNALAVGRSRDDASIVLTTGLVELLDPAEQEAVLAHELVHIEAEDVKAVGLADAVADSVADLGRIKGTFLWGPRNIVVDMVPFILTSVAAWVVIWVLPKPNGAESLGGVLLLLLFVAIALGSLIAIAGSALVSWRGLVQLFLFVTFFGPLTVIEMALAPPTAIALSRLISRTRVYEADRRTVELTGDRAALISALAKLEYVEQSPDTTWSGHLRFSLLVTPRAQRGYRAWLEHVYATHPSIAGRIEALGEAGTT